MKLLSLDIITGMPVNSLILPQTARRSSRFRQPFLAFLALLFALLATAACTAVDTPQDSTPSLAPSQQLTRTPRPARTQAPTPTATQPTPPPLLEELAGLNIQLWHILPEDQLNALVSQFNRGSPWKFTVEPRHFADGNLLRLALAAETPPAVLSGYPDELLALEDEVGLVDLQPYLDDLHWGWSAAEQDDFYPVFWQQDTLEGKRLGIPVQRTGYLLLYNSTWAGELGFSIPPGTASAFRQQTCSANQSKRQDETVQNDSTGGWIVSEQPAAMLGWIWAFGGEVLLPSGSRYRFETSQTEQAFRYLKSLYDQNCAWLTQEPYPDEPFATRQGLLAGASLGELPFITQAFAEADSSDSWTVLPFPSSTGKPVVPVTGVSLALIPGEEREQLAGWLFISWLASPETQAVWLRMSGEFPVRKSAFELLGDFAAANPQWRTAVGLLPFARTEPPLASWGAVQWALQDAGTQLFRSYFTADRIPETLQELDRTASDLHAMEAQTP